jgi:hypothetical protein
MYQVTYTSYHNRIICQWRTKEYFFLYFCFSFVPSEYFTKGEGLSQSFRGWVNTTRKVNITRKVKLERRDRVAKTVKNNEERPPSSRVNLVAKMGNPIYSKEISYLQAGLVAKMSKINENWRSNA